MKSLLTLVFGLFLIGCSSGEFQHRLLDVNDVRLLVSSEKPYPEEIAGRIVKVEEEVRELRQTLLFFVFSGVLEVDPALLADEELRIADYFHTSAWASMVERDYKSAEIAAKEAESAFQRSLDMIKSGMDKGSI
jgi:hypothetical protein